MNITFPLNPVYCASNDETRYVLNGVCIRGNPAIATDGRSMFACLASRDCDEHQGDVVIPTRAIKKGMPKRKSSVLPCITLKDGDAPVVSILDKQLDTTEIKPIDGKFPKLNGVVPDQSKHTLRLGLNAKLLSNIAEAYGDSELVLHLDPSRFEEYGYKDAFFVTGKTRDAVAVLMPILIMDQSILTVNNALAEIKKQES